VQLYRPGHGTPHSRAVFSAKRFHMIDFHTHILPGIDDGSRDIDMTEKMLRMEQAMGVSHIYATPHFYAHRRSVEYFLEKRSKAINKVNELLATDESLPRITAGAEVYYFTGIGRAGQLEDLCIEGTNILLLELPFAQWHSDIAKDVEEILDKRSLRIVLAHVERYEVFQKDRSTWNRIINMPLTIQLNGEDILDSGSIFRKNHRHKICFEVLNHYNNVIIGSDCHDLGNRKPNLDEARVVIRKKIGSERLSLIDEYTEKLLNGR